MNKTDLIDMMISLGLIYGTSQLILAVGSFFNMFNLAFAVMALSSIGYVTVFMLLGWDSFYTEKLSKVKVLLLRIKTKKALHNIKTGRI